MMHINIDVQDTVVVLQKLQNREHNIIYIAKARRFLFLGMVKAAAPIDSDVSRSMIKFDCSIDGGTS